MTNKIKHLGVVENINGLHVKVRIVQTSACSACSIKGHCTASDMKEKMIDAYNVHGNPIEIGQRVMVCGTTSMGMKAVLMAFAVPFLVLLVTLFVTMKLSEGDEILSSVISLAMLVPYYFIIYKLKDKFSKTFSFTIESINY